MSMNDSKELNNRIDPFSEHLMEGQKKYRGRLKIFFGYANGVGKTYAMLDEAKDLYKNGLDVVIGYLNPKVNQETKQLMKGLPALPLKVIGKNKEFDIDRALARKPKLILVDELAHTNAKGVRNRKRYQDIEELLNAGIDVYTTVNIQHLESMNDIVYDITQFDEKETIPNYIFEHADKVILIDIEPDELIKRFEKNLNADIHEKALYFTKENLKLLREISLRKVADRISHYNQNDHQNSDKAANIKLMVCISSSPSSTRCIRWTARTAEAFHAPWVAVYVENIQDDGGTEEEKNLLQDNLALAEQLGAETVILNGYDIPTTVANYAKLTGITNIVIGKSRNKKSLKNLFEQDIEDILVTLLNNIEIHIIPDNDNIESYHQHKNKKSFRGISFSLRDFCKTAVILTLTTILAIGLKFIEFDNSSILYILSVVMISRITSGYMYGTLASFISVLLFTYIFEQPYYSFAFISHRSLITLIVMLITALITSALTIRIKAQAEFALEREKRTEVLYEINKKLLVTRGLENIIDISNKYLEKVFESSVIFYSKDPITGAKGILEQSKNDPDALALLSPKENAVAHWVFLNQKNAGAGTDTFSDAKAYYFPIIFQGNVLGVVGVSYTNGLLRLQSNRILLRRIASQIAIALERQRLSDEQRVILVESEKEKMRSNLLRAISHDLRTPLTGILGASSTILENYDSLNEQTKKQLIRNIKDDSQWLIRMVENLLSVTRINEDTANVTKTPEAAEEIVATAIRRIRKRFPDSKIKVSVPEELLMVPMDGTLIEQVIINLVENAIKHSGNDKETEVILRKEGNYAVFEVSDHGEGIAKKDFPYLFESYIPNGMRSSDSSRGMGIGLSICKSIIKAHNGNIEAENKKEGGALFRFTLPL